MIIMNRLIKNKNVDRKLFADMAFLVPKSISGPMFLLIKNPNLFFLNNKVVNNNPILSSLIKTLEFYLFI